MREDQEKYDDGLNAARGILLALGISLVFWAVVIGAYCLGRAAPDVPHDSPRSVQVVEVT